mgnify:CR=1 FL=1
MMLMSKDNEVHDDNGEQIIIDVDDYHGVNVDVNEGMKHEEEDIGVGDQNDEDDNVDNSGQC